MRQIRIVAWLAVIAFTLVLGFLMLTRTDGPQQSVSSAIEDRDYSFVLSDHTGAVVDSGSFEDAYKLVYFGFTFCPDACPTTMAKLSLALETLADSGISIDTLQPIFISVDPDRDTAEELGYFKENFHPKLAVLRGEQALIDDLVGRYGGYYKLRNEEADDDLYLVDHLDVIFVISPDGSFSQILTSRDSLEDLVAKLGKLVSS